MSPVAGATRDDSRMSSSVGVKRHPPAFSRFSALVSRQNDDRLAGGSLRCLLTSTAAELLGRSLAASTNGSVYRLGVLASSALRSRGQTLLRNGYGRWHPQSVDASPHGNRKAGMIFGIDRKDRRIRKSSPNYSS